jgi:hypothetical protein
MAAGMFSFTQLLLNALACAVLCEDLKVSFDTEEDHRSGKTVLAITQTL